MSAEVATKPIKTIRKKIAKTVEPNTASVSVRENNENSHEAVEVKEPSVKVAKTQKVKSKDVELATESVESDGGVSGESSSGTESSIRSRLESILKSNTDRISELKSQNVELKKLQKEHEVQLKLASKKKKKVVDPNAPKRKATGFAAKGKISPELHQFLKQFNVGDDELLSRIDVARYMSEYIKTNNLVDPDHSKEFIPDAALKALITPAESRRVKDDPSSPLVYKSFEIQKHLKHHFIKSDVTA